jgi:myo-inositol-1-phosphate synthase
MAIGVWFVGGRGSLATTATAGLALMGRQATPVPAYGLVTELAEFAGLDLPAFDDIVVGGHDVSEVPVTKRAEELARAGVLPQFALPLVETSLQEADGRIRPGIRHPSGRASIALVQDDLRSFRDANGLDAVIVVNVSSTEAIAATHDAHATLQALDVALDAGEHDVLPVSSLYAYAALDLGMPFVDFTPSTGVAIPALDELARLRDVPYAGRDGKTGETLVKTALTPMFLSRNLHISSWAGLNLLGGGDGRSLSEPERKASKLASKARSLQDSLGYDVDAPVGIEYVEDMDEWKTAWNQIRFQGFLGTTMTMQITWQGCDSALAAPLVIDLVRLTAFAHHRGESGALPALAFFFKDPIGSDEHRLTRQFDHLVEWARRLPPSA